MTDRVVLITGGSRGLGLELARVFGSRGARVVIAARDEAELTRAQSDLVLRGIQALALPVDMRDRGAVEQLVATITERWGAIDVLINNAGVIEVGPLDAMTIDDYRNAMDTHFWAPMYAVNAVLPSMRARRTGRILNISSIGGRVSVPHLLPYSASKFALTGYSEGLRAELGRFGIKVTTVVPGLMRTGSPERATFKGRNRLEYLWFTISDSLPFISVDVTAAAQAIADAAERGSATLTISLPAKVLALAHGIAPGIVSDVLGLVARLLPPFGGIGTASRPGYASHTSIVPSFFTAATRRRAKTQNEEPLGHV